MGKNGGAAAASALCAFCAPQSPAGIDLMDKKRAGCFGFCTQAKRKNSSSLSLFVSLWAGGRCRARCSGPGWAAGGALGDFQPPG